MSKLLVGSATDVGLVRTNNQDELLVAPGLYAVADGMGGHAAGEVASSTAIRALQAAFAASDQHSAESLASAARAANRAVWEQARANRGMLGMGTTLVALAVVEKNDGTNGLAVAHIGDSRLYLLRDQQLHQLTVDHSLVQELVDDGQISPAQAAVHPQRHVLTRALGVEPSVDVDLIEVVAQHGDRFLLCSDGLPREASDDQIAAVLLRFADPTEAAKELVVLAKSRGGSDNITVVVVDVLASDSSPDALIVVPGPASSPRPPRPPTGPYDPAGPNDPSGPGDPEGTNDWSGPGGPGPGGASGPRDPGRSHGPAGPDDDDGRRGPGGHRGTTANATGISGPTAGNAFGSRLAHRLGHRGSASSPRKVTWRVVSFVAALCIVVGGAIACLAWYARSAYYVTLSEGHIAVFQGRPGGVLWFQPTLAYRSKYTSSSVLAYNLTALDTGQLEPSLGQARLYISRLVSEKIEAEGSTPPTARGAPRSRHRRSRTAITARTATTAAGPATSTTRGSLPTSTTLSSSP